MTTNPQEIKHRKQAVTSTAILGFTLYLVLMRRPKLYKNFSISKLLEELQETSTVLNSRVTCSLQKYSLSAIVRRQPQIQHDDSIFLIYVCLSSQSFFFFQLLLTANRITLKTIKQSRRTDHSPGGFVFVTRRDCPTNASSSLILSGTSLNTYGPAEKNKNSNTTYINGRKLISYWKTKYSTPCLRYISIIFWKVSFKKQ